MARYYQAADVCVSIPSSDSSPRSVWEAMACGCPVVRIRPAVGARADHAGARRARRPGRCRRRRRRDRAACSGPAARARLADRGRAARREPTATGQAEMDRLARVYRSLRAMPALTTITDGASSLRSRTEWDALVLAMPRPSPFLLHGWLLEWWRHHGRRSPPVRHVAREARPADRRATAVRRAPLRPAGRARASARTPPRSPTSSSRTTRTRRRRRCCRPCGRSGADLADVFGLPQPAGRPAAGDGRS